MIDKEKTAALIKKQLEESKLKEYLSEKQLKKMEKMMTKAFLSKGLKQKLYMSRFLLISTLWGMKMNPKENKKPDISQSERLISDLELDRLRELSEDKTNSLFGDRMHEEQRQSNTDRR